MNKKIVSTMLATAMTLGMTAGTAVPAMAEDTFNLKMQIVTFGQEFPGLADVENAINAVTEPEIGVTVTLDPIAAWDLPSTSALAITSNEEIDLMSILPMGSNMDSISNYSTKNFLWMTSMRSTVQISKQLSENWKKSDMPEARCMRFLQTTMQDMDAAS